MTRIIVKFAFATVPLNCSNFFFLYLLRFEIDLLENFAKSMIAFSRKSSLSQNL